MKNFVGVKFQHYQMHPIMCMNASSCQVNFTNLTKEFNFKTVLF